jgi:hypothetical protein
MDRGAITDFAEVADAVLAGRALVWIAIAREDGRKRPDGNGTSIGRRALLHHRRLWRA